MPFRLKLGLSFCSILFLTITVALASWWGMHSAVNRQNDIFSFALDVHRLFSAMAHEEYTFNATQEIGYTHKVNTILNELRATIGDVHKRSEQSRQGQVENLLADLRRYQDNFSDFIGQMVNMEAMQSRMIQESDRLLSNTRALTDLESDKAAQISLLTSQMLQEEKTYLLSGSRDSARTVLTTVTDIGILAKKILNQAKENSQRLKAYRITKMVSVYQDIFSLYLNEKDNLQQMILLMHYSQKKLATELGAFVDKELAHSRRHVSKLQLFTIVVSLVAVVLSVIITLLLSDRITRPLEQLKNSARDILNGKLDTAVTIKTKDEIGQLGDIFNRMTLKLRQNFEDISVYRNHLEDLVEERTFELKNEMAERNAAENALRASEQQLRTIVDQSPMGIILWNKDFQVSQWNQAAERIFGYTAAEAIGLPAQNFLPQSMHASVDKIWQKLLAAQNGVRSRNDNIRKDGKIIQCDWFNTPLFDSSGNLPGALSLVENVTERIRTEKELLKIDKLESTGLLAGGIAHDFNNIITAVLGNINLSLFDENLSSKTRDLLISAEKASIRAKDLTQQLLTFAKGGEPIRESTSLAEIIIDSAAFVLHGGNVSCTYQLPDDLWYAVVDRGQISQVIQNIVLNSRHAMPKGGKITISCDNVNPKEHPFTHPEPTNRFVKISIKDNGIGIHADLLDKIFDPYFSTKQEGSGLGLAITHSIINRHHGHILVNSELGNGTEFTIYLPATSRPVDKKETRQDIRATTTPLTVLVMDDDKSVQMVLQRMLQKLGHTVVLANEGREAIHLYLDSLDSAEPVDLVIVDLTIPGGLGGKETMVELLKINPEIRVIVSSGYSNDPIMAFYKDHGFCAAVTKPYVLKALSEAIEVACSN
ncbi:MAG: PAS domain S-box protein [Desulforhopalus sp.]